MSLRQRQKVQKVLRPLRELSSRQAAENIKGREPEHSAPRPLIYFNFHTGFHTTEWPVLRDHFMYQEA